MIETLLVWIILGCTAFYLGKKLYRQWKIATAPGNTVSCANGCCGCVDTACDTRDRAE